nr:MAG TPA: hypothetical protein [Caudoviricetes sp.]
MFSIPLRGSPFVCYSESRNEHNPTEWRNHG